MKMRFVSKLAVSLVLACQLCPQTVLAQAQTPLEPTPSSAAPTAQVISLEEALRRVDAQNQDLAQVRARTEEAQGIARQALAALLPVLVATGAYTRNNEGATIEFSRFLDTLEQGLSQIAQRPITLDRSGAPADRIIQPLDALTVNGTLRLPLFAANAYWDVLAAKEGVNAANASVSVARQRTRSALLRALWLGSTAEAFVEVAQRGVNTSEQYVKTAERAVGAGTSVPLAVLRAQTELARRQKELSEARNKLEAVRLSIGLLLGEQQPVQVQLPPLEMPGTLAEDALIEEALKARAEVGVQEAMRRAADHGITSAWWRLAPTLTATGSVFASDTPFLTGDKTGWRAALELTWTLYDGGLRYGKLRQARGNLARVQAEKKGLELQISQEIRNALREFRLGQEQLTLSERQRALAQEAARTAQSSFEGGVASYTEVLDTLDRLYQAEAGEQEARARLAIAIITLKTARGQVW
ncbi:Outer membrane efflux family protein [Stigmatella aurantiaca DW4/3-1]|uniref:Outer membrane efflux family protein n=2 Tax=Stigmatella aurantiaca (strain DW4/3-1) TaxID=378806 RepID=E3FY41_STIAD|nr:TolC family protein [Stigmatella aurantiaca]ADO68578.1 Outer membrane efflux family protein [Stigmatella aurantiaca DW4/3-1]